MDLDDEELKATRILNRADRKTADEMFKKLGYEKQENERYIFYYQYNGAKEKFGYEFTKPMYEEQGEVYPVCYSETDEAISVTMQELQAINKKCEELGWI